MKLRMSSIADMIAIVSMFAGANGLGQEATAQLSTVDRVRNASLEMFTLAVEVDRRATPFMPGQGRTTRLLRVTVNRDVTAIVWKVKRLEPFKYYPPGTDGYQGCDFDSEGHLILGIPVEGGSICDPETNDEYQADTVFIVASDGSSAQTDPHPLLHRHHISSRNTESQFLLRRILWALGRPWPIGTPNVLSEQDGPNGTRRIRLTGWWASTPGTGITDLLISPNEGFLVRRGAHFAEGQPPRGECYSEGIRWFGSVALAEHGEFVLGGAETINVRLVSFSTAFDPDLEAEARNMVARARSQRVQVTDFRVEDPTKRRRTFAPGELDEPLPPKP